MCRASESPKLSLHVALYKFVGRISHFAFCAMQMATFPAAKLRASHDRSRWAPASETFSGAAWSSDRPAAGLTSAARAPCPAATSRSSAAAGCRRSGSTRRRRRRRSCPLRRGRTTRAATHPSTRRARTSRTPPPRPAWAAALRYSQPDLRLAADLLTPPGKEGVYQTGGRRAVSHFREIFRVFSMPDWVQQISQSVMLF